MRLLQWGATPATLLWVILLASCDVDIPEDAEGSFLEASAGVLRVGVTENPPWIIRCDGDARGVEAALIKDFAAGINAHVEWVWGSPPQLMRGLENHELHLVGGGIEKDTPWSTKVGLTRPYIEVRYGIGAPAGAALPESFKGMTVSVQYGSPAREPLNKLEANLIFHENPWNFPGLVAAPVWDLSARGYSIHYPALVQVQYCIAAPRGENRLITHLERFLAQQPDIWERYVEAARMHSTGKLCEEPTS